MSGTIVNLPKRTLIALALAIAMLAAAVGYMVASSDHSGASSVLKSVQLVKGDKSGPDNAEKGGGDEGDHGGDEGDDDHGGNDKDKDHGKKCKPKGHYGKPPKPKKDCDDDDGDDD